MAKKYRVHLTGEELVELKGPVSEKTGSSPRFPTGQVLAEGKPVYPSQG